MTPSSSATATTLWTIAVVAILVVLGVSFSAGTTFPGGVAALPADRQHRGSILRRRASSHDEETTGLSSKSQKADPAPGTNSNSKKATSKNSKSTIDPDTRRRTAASTPRGLKPLSSEYYGKTAKSHKADPEHGKNNSEKAITKKVGPDWDNDDTGLETSRDDKSNGAGYYSSKSSKSVDGKGYYSAKSSKSAVDGKGKGAAGYYSAKSSKSVDGKGKGGAGGYYSSKSSKSAVDGKGKGAGGYYSAKSSKSGKSSDGKGKGADVEDDDSSMDTGKGKGYESKKSKSAYGKGKGGYDSKKSKSDKKSGYGKGSKGKGGDYRVIVIDSANLEDAVTDGEVIAADKNATQDDTSEDEKSPLASLLDSFKDTDTDIEASEDSSKDDSEDAAITLPSKKNTTAVNETEDVTSNDMSSEDEKNVLICGTDQDCIDKITAGASCTTKSMVSLLVAVATVVTITTDMFV